jgi:hypothetical protein
MIEEPTRKTGISILGDMPWGTHLCHFYDTKTDLLETLVPYIKAGLESNELCVWVHSSDLNEAEISDAMTRALSGFDRYRAEGRIEIFSDREWYFQDGTPDLKQVLLRWNEKLSQARARGFEGIRVTGRPIYFENKHWNGLSAYEKELDESMANLRMICLCSYPTQICGAAEVLDVARNHQAAIARRDGIWEVLETAGLKEAKSEIKRLH